jgi:hypothetical protein
MAVARRLPNGKGLWCAMRFRRGGRPRKLRPRRALVAALLIANQFLLASGLPLPVAAAGPKKDISKPFPCMNRPCGCLNADQCWHSCCCFTMREKLAWAKAHGVEPPTFVCEAAAEEEREEAAHAAHRLVRAGEKHCCCCCCCAKKSPSSSENADRRSATNPKKDSSEPASPTDGKSIVLIMALGCQGQTLLSILAQSLPAYVPGTPRYDFLPCAVVCTVRRSFESVRFSPPVPPPEFSDRILQAQSA